MKEKLNAFGSWVRYKLNREFETYARVAGYYNCHVGTIYTFDMESGRKASFKCIDIEYFLSPGDMIKKARYQMVQYEGEKTPKECTFKEFCNIYLVKYKY